MKKIRWKRDKREDRYGKWYSLSCSFRWYGKIWIREPYCYELAVQNNFPSKKNNHENCCPRKGDCGWLMCFGDFDINDHPLEATSLREAKEEAATIIKSKFDSFFERLTETI